MTSVWVVEDGEYSDYRVVGVFSSKKNAERVCKLTGGEIAKWRMNPAIDELNAGLHFYRVEIAKDGTVSHCGRHEPSTYDIDGTYESTPWVDYRDHSLGVHLIVRVWASDDNHAIKIANERRMQKIANGEWDK
jgi:hypothetical protein